MSVKAFIGSLTVIIVCGLLFYYSSDLSKILKNKVLNPVKKEAPMIAHLELLKGSAVIESQEREIKLNKSQKYTLYPDDRLQILESAEAEISFPSGYILKILPSTYASLSFWNKDNPQLISVLHIASGDYELVKQGSSGKLYMVKNRQLFIPENQPVNPDGLLLEPLKKPQKTKESQNLKKINEIKKPIPDVIDGKTLSNNYLDQMIGRQKNKFLRCQKISMKNQPQLSGKILFGLKIIGSGKVDEIKILDSNLNNTQFESCLLTVLQRVKLKHFTGEPIYRSYPIEFN